jgi:CubicO group peptidase (beta-lactamase class C family)
VICLSAIRPKKFRFLINLKTATHRQLGYRALERRARALEKLRHRTIAAFIPALELLIAEAMDEWKIPGLAVAVVQNGEVR